MLARDAAQHPISRPVHIHWRRPNSIWPVSAATYSLGGGAINRGTYSCQSHSSCWERGIEMPGGPNAVTASAVSQRVGDIESRRGRVGGARGRWGVKPWFDGRGVVR